MGPGGYIKIFVAKKQQCKHRFFQPPYRQKPPMKTLSTFLKFFVAQIFTLQDPVRIYSSMHHYYILNLNPQVANVFEFIKHHKLEYEIHANRTRFLVPEGTVLTEFLLRFSLHCELVDPSLDLLTGHPIA